ncbi:MAG TPA: hypothetical protein VGB55_02620 [Tepidisphaeraceae bacterium]|jgi:hypothetical protein
MIQHTPLQRNDILTAKDRLRFAAREAAPSKAIRAHPWAAVIGTAASTFTITAIIGSLIGRRGSRKTYSHGVATGGRSSGFFGSIAPLLTPFSGLAMKVLEGYLMKKAVTGTEPAKPGEYT